MTKVKNSLIFSEARNIVDRSNSRQLVFPFVKCNYTWTPARHASIRIFATRRQDRLLSCQLDLIASCSSRCLFRPAPLVYKHTRNAVQLCTIFFLILLYTGCFTEIESYTTAVYIVGSRKKKLH